jgi:tetratricopeptide (TPR) repeat protein
LLIVDSYIAEVEPNRVDEIIVAIEYLQSTMGSHSILDSAEALSSNEVASHSRSYRRKSSIGDLDGGNRNLRRLNDLGRGLQIQFQHTGLMQDLDQDISNLRHAVANTPENHLSYAMHLNNLGLALEMRFKGTGSIQDLDQAISNLDQAVALTSTDHRNHAEGFNNLGLALRMRAERSGSLGDLDQGTSNMETVAATLSDYRAVCLNNLGLALQTRFERTKSMQDLDQAISILEQAQATSTNYSDSMQYNLGLVLQMRFERTGSLQDLDQTISNLKSLASTSTDHPTKQAEYLNKLGLALEMRFERTGSLQDLIQGTSNMEQAVASTPSNHPSRVEYLNNLGVALSKRYERSGSMQDLDQSISNLEQALASTTLSPPDHAALLNNLGYVLRMRFDRTGLMQDLDRAISNAEHTSTFTDHSDRAACCNNLGLALQRRFEQTGSMQDLDQAISKLEHAVSDTPADHFNHAMYLDNFGRALSMRFEQTGSLKDLDQGISNLEQAVASTPTDNPRRGRYLNALGRTLLKRSAKTRSDADQNAAVTALEAAVDLISGCPTWRINSARRAAKILESTDVLRVTRLLKTAVQLLPTISPRSQNRTDQQHSLSDSSGLASDAAAFSLQAAQATAAEALQLLEVGRGIMTSFELDTRTDLTDLFEAHPDLARQFCDLRDALDASNVSRDETLIVNPPGNSVRSSSDRHVIAKDFEDIVELTRTQPGFERFLLAATEEQFKALAQLGPIVILNVAEVRSDAFLVTSNGVSNLHLPDLTDELVRSVAKEMRGWCNNEGREERDMVRQGIQMGDTMKGILEWLWSAAVGPVLAELRITGPPEDEESYPHVWWVATGRLSLLPIHVAGYHLEGSSENALDRIISSYIPSLKSLGYAQDRIRKIANDQYQTALFLSMEETPDQAKLPGAAKEAQQLSTILSNHVNPVVLEGPAKAEVLGLLPELNICHFACHGISHPMDPSKSQLVLQDWKENPLFVNDIVRLRLENSQFAYLSACSVADCQVEKLLDEGINLASAFQLAGFPSVVGTLWPINDHYSVEVAEEVYRGMIDGDKLDVRKSAAALNLAVRRLRDKLGGESVSVWAPYIHIGV